MERGQDGVSLQDDHSYGISLSSGKGSVERFPELKKGRKRDLRRAFSALPPMTVQINDTAEHVDNEGRDLSLAGPLPLIDKYECLNVGDRSRVFRAYPSKP